MNWIAAVVGGENIIDHGLAAFTSTNPGKGLGFVSAPMHRDFETHDHLGLTIRTRKGQIFSGQASWPPTMTS
jgi:hypothetical protein